MKKHQFCSYTIEGLHTDLIYKQTFHAAKVAYVVNMVSKSYVEVSKEHIMSRIAGETFKYFQGSDRKMKEISIFLLLVCLSL